MSETIHPPPPPYDDERDDQTARISRALRLAIRPELDAMREKVETKIDTHAEDDRARWSLVERRHAWQAGALAVLTLVVTLAAGGVGWVLVTTIDTDRDAAVIGRDVERLDESRREHDERIRALETKRREGSDGT